MTQAKCKVWHEFDNGDVVLELEDGTHFVVPKTQIEDVHGLQLKPTFTPDEARINPPMHTHVFVRVAQSTLDRVREISRAKAQQPEHA